MLAQLILTRLTKMASWQYQLLLRIIAQLREDGRTIKWDKINFPGRNVKSMKNIWTRINKQIADLDTQENDGEPTPVKTPRKKGPGE